MSPLSVSDCLEDVSMLSEEVGVSSLGGLIGLDVLELRKGDEFSLNFLNGSVGWKRDKGLLLLGELS